MNMEYNMPRTPINQVCRNINTCDHCNQKVNVLWIDYTKHLFCPDCWELYHIASGTRKRLINLYRNLNK